MSASTNETGPDEHAVIVAVTGGIAAYKSCALVSRLVQADYAVTVLMTESATRFVAPLTFETLSGRPVYTSIWHQVEAHDSQHIALARSARLMIIAPASANTIAKLAQGICDNVVTTVACALGRQTKVLIAPAMNAAMWANPITQANAARLREVLGYEQVGPEAGWQACRTQGPGRMAEPETIYERAVKLLG
jgi:phosphopantothenoylcysteine decarboxylase/phosphopantothenate--cysteine ligase